VYPLGAEDERRAALAVDGERPDRARVEAGLREAELDGRDQQLSRRDAA